MPLTRHSLPGEVHHSPLSYAVDYHCGTAGRQSHAHLALLARRRGLRQDLEHVEPLADRGREVDTAAEARRGERVDAQRLEEGGRGDDLAGRGVAPGERLLV